MLQAGLPHRWWPHACRYFATATKIMGNEGKPSPWEKRFGSAFSGLRIPFGAGVRLAPPRPLAKRLPKFSPNAVPGIFLGWGVHPGGKWTGEYLVAHWPDYQSQGVTASRIPIYTVQEFLLMTCLPVSSACPN